MSNSALAKIQNHLENPVMGQVPTVIVFALLAHLLVVAVRQIGDWLIRKSASKKIPVGFVTQQPKFITFTGLISSGLTFAIYFVAIGYILKYAFDVNLTAYMATASVIGLAVGFGSQGLVQDVVTSLTLILSDTLDVGDLIEVSGQIGRVERVGLRFTHLVNFYNQEVFVPNRTIGNVSRFPGGGVFAYADVQLPRQAEPARVVLLVRSIADGMWREFGAIILSEPVVGKVQPAHPDAAANAVPGATDEWTYLRVQFKIWPGQGSLIETTFRQHAVNALKGFDPAYADWMVTVTYRAAVLTIDDKARL